MTDLQVSPIAKGNIIGRLWRGEVSLPIAYFVYGGLVSVLLRLTAPAITYAIFANSKSLSAFDIAAVTYGWQTLLLVYVFFISVSIWRSASRYTREHPTRWWGKVAQLMVILGALFNIGSLVDSNERTIADYKSGSSADAQLQTDAMIAGMNKGLPKMVDQWTRLDKVDYNPLGFTYYNTITFHLDDPATFVSKMKNNITKGLCKEGGNTLSLLKENGLSFKYLYYDTNGNNVAQVIVTSSDCNALKSTSN